MAAFALDIITPEKTIFSGQVERLRALGSEGSFGVLARHAPMIASLQIGPLTLAGIERNYKLSVSGGFLEVVPGGRVSVLSETAEFGEEIDVERARQSQDRARDRLAQLPDSGIDATRTQAALLRALNRLKVANIS